MKHWEMRRRIAELQGWTSIHESGRLDGQLVGYPPVPVIHDYEEIPDYVRDLNAMHEAESKLSGDQHIRYRDQLIKITTLYECSDNDRAYCSATAAQRAEALLKTIGKWEDS